MRNTLAGFVVVSLVASAGYAHAETERLTRTLSLDPGGTLRVNNFSGHVRISGTSDSNVTITAVRYGSRYTLDRIGLDIRGDGSYVSIEANRRQDYGFKWFGWRDDVVETELDIRVPRRTNLNVNVFKAPITVDGVEGSHRLKTFSSRVDLDNVVGPVEVRSFSGPVEIRTTEWQDAQRLDVETFSGGITLRVPDAARGVVRLNTFSGQLSSSLPLRFQRSNRRQWHAEIGDGGSGTLRLKTFSGDVRIDR